MKHILKAALIAGALGASPFLIASPASAHEYRSGVSVYIDAGPVAVRYSDGSRYDRYRRSYRCSYYRHRHCHVRRDRGRHYGWRRGRHRGWRD